MTDVWMNDICNMVILKITNEPKGSNELKAVSVMFSILDNLYVTLTLRSWVRAEV